jgi:hypothetical protein
MINIVVLDVVCIKNVLQMVNKIHKSILGHFNGW